MKIGKPQQGSDIERSSLQCFVPTALRLVKAPVGQDTMHSPHETQEELAHGQIVVEGNASLISLAASRQHPVVANLIATADAAIAQDAGFMIDSNCQGRIVTSARGRAPRKPRLLESRLALPDAPIHSLRNAAAARRERDGRTSTVQPACGERPTPARCSSSPSFLARPGECTMRRKLSGRRPPRTRGTLPPDFHSAGGKGWGWECRGCGQRRK